MKRSIPIALGVALFVALLGLGLGWGVNTVVVARLLALPDGAEVPSVAALAAPDDEEAAVRNPVDAVTSTVPRRTSRSQYVDQLMRRNLFDSEAIASWNPNPAAVEDDETPVSDIKVKLLATAIAEPSLYSQALIIEDSDEAIARGYRIGDDLFGAEVVNIEPNRVTIRRNGQLEYVTMDDKLTPAPRTSTASRSTEKGDDEVKEVGENEFVVAQSLIDTYLNDLEAISRMGRALLHRGPDGEFDGYRMSAIRRDTLPDKLGIKNGDIIHAVNGLPLTSVQGAMSAYQSLQNDKNFSFEVTRRGQKVTMKYDVQ